MLPNSFWNRNDQIFGSQKAKWGELHQTHSFLLWLTSNTATCGSQRGSDEAHQPSHPATAALVGSRTACLRETHTHGHACTHADTHVRAHAYMHTHTQSGPGNSSKHLETTFQRLRRLTFKIYPHMSAPPHFAEVFESSPGRWAHPL